MPQRTDDAAEAYLLLQMDGAAILEWPRTDVDIVEEVTRAIFGQHLRAFRPPAHVLGNRIVAGGAQFDWAAPSVSQADAS